MKTPLIEFKDVYKRYGEKVVLEGVSFKVYPSEITTIIGKSGVGKSVTLKLMIGLERPDKGTFSTKVSQYTGCQSPSGGK